MNNTDRPSFRRQWATRYLTSRWHDQKLYLSKITVEQYIAANMFYVLRNIKNGLNKEWNRQIEGRIE